MADISPRPLKPNLYGVFACPGTNGNTWMSTTYNPTVDFFPQVDAMAALGANFITYFGDVSWWNAAPITLSTYLARRREMAQYVASKGLLALTYASMTWANQGGISNTDLITLLVEDAKLMASFPNQIGYVTMDEPWLGSPSEGGSIPDATIVSRLAAQYAAVKAVVPASFPIATAPNPVGDFSFGSNVFQYADASKTKCDSVAAYNDFFCFHPFYVASLSDSAAVRAAYPNKPILMPSFGDISNGDGSLASKFSSVMGLVGSNGFRACSYFISVDYDATTRGMWNNDGNGGPPTSARTAKTSAFTTGNVGGPVLRQHRRYPGKPRLTQFRNWGYQ